MGSRNPRVLELRRIVERASSTSAEIVLEGPRTVSEALNVGLRLSAVVVPESKTGDRSVLAVLARLGNSVELVVVRDKLFSRLAPAVTPQPMLAVATRPEASLPTVFNSSDFALVLVGVADPGNVGTLIRVADATNARCAVVIGGADPWRPKAVRASAASVLRVPVVSAIDPHEMLQRLRAAGAKIVASDAHQGVPHDSGVLTRPLAIVLGSEAHGLTDSVGCLVDEWVRIDMAGNVESLNVAMAGTLLAFQASKPSKSNTTPPNL